MKVFTVQICLRSVIVDLLRDLGLKNFKEIYSRSCRTLEDRVGRKNFIDLSALLIPSIRGLSSTLTVLLSMSISMINK